MKQLILSLLLAVCTVCSAQTNHMKFKGIPMEGTLQSFTTKLKAKGYTPIGIQDGVSLLKGEFAGYNRLTGKYYVRKIYEKGEIEEVLTLRTDWQQRTFAAELKRCLYRFLEEKKTKIKKK